jgi:hypothetical protein
MNKGHLAALFDTRWAWESKCGLLRQLAEVRALENGGDDKADKLINAFKEFAQSPVVRT